MNPKLILVEGLPGSGKSTTARIVKEILLENNVDAELFMEGNLDHPADFDGVACFTKPEFSQLLDRSGGIGKIFQERVIVKKGRYLLPYMKIKNELGQEISDEILTIVSKKDIYELPLEQNTELITERWQEFAHQALLEDKVYIFECCFIQNPVTVGMVKHAAPEEQTIDYVGKLAESIKDLNPLLIYVQQGDIEKSFKKAVDERPEDWFNGFTNYYTSQGYGLKHGLKGLGGTVEVLKARQGMELKILGHLKISTFILDNSGFELETHRARLEVILNENIHMASV